MPEGKGEMPSSPEARKPETQKPFQPSWIIEREDEFSGMNPSLQLRVRQIHQAPESIAGRGYLEKHYLALEEQVVEGKIPEDEAGIVLAKIVARIEELESQPKAHEGVSKVRTESPVERVLGDLSVQLGGLVKLLEQSGQLRPSLTPEQVEQISTAQVMAVEQQRTESLRGIFGRLPPELEMSRWVDVEYDQEFYTRFQPNQEPNFYTALGTEQRKIWDARWRLARAAYVKKVLSAQPEKLAENQDLIELTKEQMETLYNIDGVREALRWYAEVITKGSPFQINGQKMTIFDCKSGSDFQRIRARLRRHLAETVFQNVLRKGSNEEKTRGLKREYWMKLRSADAIAWNWIFCGNLVESVDSRYSRYPGSRMSKEGGRHAYLAPAICSDDLRAVFHPQEKFEDKCRKGQEWGNFGRWGITQMERIMRPLEEDEKKRKEEEEEARKEAERKGEDRVRNEFKHEFIFEGASSLEDFWVVGRINEELEEKKKGDKIIKRIYTKRIPIKVPECYPITSMKSFWETFDEGERKKTLLERLIVIDGDPINWKSVDADPWKTSYLTIKLRKAVGLFEVFTKESKEGWARALLDIYTRLNSRGVLEEYYEGTLNLPVQKIKQEAERLANIHFHNLKVWADYAVQGGVGRPQDRLVTDPYSPSILGQSTGWNRTIHETILRKPQAGYLDKGESLLITSVK